MTHVQPPLFKNCTQGIVTNDDDLLHTPITGPIYCYPIYSFLICQVHIFVFRVTVISDFFHTPVFLALGLPFPQVWGSTGFQFKQAVEIQQVLLISLITRGISYCYCNSTDEKWI